MNMAKNSKTLSQKIDDVARILRENEQNLKDVGIIIKRLDILDKIYEKVATIAKEIAQPITPLLYRRSWPKGFWQGSKDP